MVFYLFIKKKFNNIGNLKLLFQKIQSYKREKSFTKNNKVPKPLQKGERQELQKLEWTTVQLLLT